MSTKQKLNVAIAFPLINDLYHHAKVKAYDPNDREALLEDLAKVEYRLKIPEGIDTTDWEEGTDVYFDRSLSYMGTTLPIETAKESKVSKTKERITNVDSNVVGTVKEQPMPKKATGCMRSPFSSGLVLKDEARITQSPLTGGLKIR